MTGTSSRTAVWRSNQPPCCLQANKLIYLGTYTLDKRSGFRSGTIETYDLQFNSVASFDTVSAVLDLKISPHDTQLMAAAHSTGCLTLWRLDADSGTPSLVQTVQVFDDDILITAVVFSPHIEGQVLVTATSGELAIVNLQTSDVETLATQHDLECWTGNFGELGELSNVVYTGGDDAKLIAHDLRTQLEIWTSKRHHQAGVVSILSPLSSWNSSNSHHLWTGSYDDHIRILDLRVIDRSNPSLIPGYVPRTIFEENLGGGVWRLIPEKLNSLNRVLVCCMYDGARIATPEGDKVVVEKYFKGDHESMCYGGDWIGNEAITCSFYDSIVQVWK